MSTPSHADSHEKAKQSAVKGSGLVISLLVLLNILNIIDRNLIASFCPPNHG